MWKWLKMIGAPNGPRSICLGWSFGDLADAHAKVRLSTLLILDLFLILPLLPLHVQLVQPGGEASIGARSCLGLGQPCQTSEEVVHAGLAQDLRAFANDAEGFSGADLASLAREAASMSVAMPCSKVLTLHGPSRKLDSHVIFFGKPF